MDPSRVFLVAVSIIVPHHLHSHLHSRRKEGATAGRPIDIKTMRSISLVLFLLPVAATAFQTSRHVPPSLAFSSSSTTSLGPLRKLGQPPDPLSYSEQSRKFRRDFFTHDSWLKHRSKDRFIGTLLKILDSGVVRALAEELFLGRSSL
jgi:hypothetical protein